MHFCRAVFFAVVLVVAAMPCRVTAEDDLLTLSNAQGSSLTFTLTEGSWRWTALDSPGAPKGGWSISEWGFELATADQTDALQPAWSCVEATADKLVFEQEASSTGLRLKRVFSFGPAPNVVRTETWVQSTGGKKLLTRIDLLAAQIEGQSFHETGAAPASFPLFGNALFAGIEHISGECRVWGENAALIQLLQKPRLNVSEEWQFVAATVVGWPVPGSGSGLTSEAQLREAFLQYLDSVRIKPEQIILHTDTWWTVAPPLSEKKVLSDIETTRNAFMERTGMFFDTYCVDLGWSDPRTFWRMDTQRFPSELRAVKEQLNALGAKPGLWMSPGSGYPDGLSNSWLQSQGYEMTPFPSKLGSVPCFALGGRYQREFKERIVAYAQQYGLGHVILDFMAQRCDVATHGHPVGVDSRYAIDAGVADVLDSLRAVNPTMVLEPMVCGYPPSPWWLMKTPFILGPAGDDVPYGRVPSPEWNESLISARDIAYRAGQEAWIMPTQALETWDIVLQTPGSFENIAAMAVGRGRWFLSTYIKPDLMKPESWDFLADLVRWARHNKQLLGNAWQFGGRPENREAYGFMFRNAGKDLYCVRNPWIEEREIVLPAPSANAASRDVRTLFPRRATVGKMQPGEDGLRIVVGPYETIFLESVPEGEAAPMQAEVAAEISLNARAPRVAPTRSEDETRGFNYSWDGVLAMPDVSDGELCILVSGASGVDLSSSRVTMGGREVTVRKSRSAGQFGAASDASPENWVWFLVSLPKGETTVRVDLSVMIDRAEVGIFVRGFTPAANDSADEGPVFPTFRPERRAWSRTLEPLRAITLEDSP